MTRSTEPALAWSVDIELPLVQFCDLCHRVWWKCGHHKQHLHYVPDLKALA